MAGPPWWLTAREWAVVAVLIAIVAFVVVRAL